jgi:hypothetical protein
VISPGGHFGPRPPYSVMPSLVVRGNTHRCAYYPGYYVKCEVSLLCTDSPLLRAGPHLYGSGLVEDLFTNPPGTDHSESSTAPVPQDPTADGAASLSGGWFPTAWLLGDPVDNPTPPPPTDKEMEIISVFAQAYGVYSGDVTWLHHLQHHNDASPDPHNPTLGQKAGNYAYVFQSQTQQLLSSMTIPLGQQRRFCFRFRLPPSLPPSYRGQAVRYCYYVWLCVIWKTRALAPRQTVVKIPFKVWSPLASLAPVVAPYAPEGFDYDWSVAELSTDWESQRTDDPMADQLVYFACVPSLAATTEERRRFQKQFHPPSNIIATNMASAITDSLSSLAHIQLPDLQVPVARRMADPYEFLHQATQHQLTTHNGLKEYIIQNQGRAAAAAPQVPFLKYLTTASHYCVGDSVQGSLVQIENGRFICVKVSVRLECEEKVPIELLRPCTVAPAKEGDGNPFATPVRVVNRLVVGEWEEYLLDCQESDFALPIGPTHPASLYTDKVTCEWVLRFEFHYAAIDGATDPHSTLQCEDPIRWHHPLHVLLPPQTCRHDKPGRTVCMVAS